MKDDELSFWSQMFESGKGGANMQFSLCFSRPARVDRGGTEAGAMTLGGTDTRLHESPMVYAKRRNTKGFYKVHVRKVYLRHGEGGESAKSSDPNVRAIPLDVEESALNNKGGVIVDSGTTNTFFPSDISSQFRAVFQELSGMVFNHTGFVVEPRELETLPTILIQLEGDLHLNKQLGDDPSKVLGLAGDLDAYHPYDIILAIPPSHYMEMGSSGKYVPRFYDNDSGGGVLGADAMMGHDVLFDVDNQVVGWAESHCDYHSLVTENGFNDPLDGAAIDSGPLQVSSETSSEEATSKDSESESLDDDSESQLSNISLESNSSENGKVQLGEEEAQDLTHSDPGSTLHLDAAPALDEAKDMKTNLREMTNACGSFYCRGGLLTVVFLLFCFGCCLGQCCCQSRSANYELTEVQVQGSFKDNDKSYCDDSQDDEYGEFVLT